DPFLSAPIIIALTVLENVPRHVLAAIIVRGHARKVEDTREEIRLAHAAGPIRILQSQLVEEIAIASLPRSHCCPWPSNIGMVGGEAPLTKPHVYQAVRGRRFPPRPSDRVSDSGSGIPFVSGKKGTATRPRT